MRRGLAKNMRDNVPKEGNSGVVRQRIWVVTLPRRAKRWDYATNMRTNRCGRHRTDCCLESAPKCLLFQYFSTIVTRENKYFVPLI